MERINILATAILLAVCCGLSSGEELGPEATVLKTKYDRYTRYVFVRKPLFWLDARAWCIEHGMELAKFSFAAESEAVHAAVLTIRPIPDCAAAKNIEDLLKNCYWAQYFIGARLSTPVQGADWVWADGSKVSSSATNWATGQPDAGNPDGVEDCVTMGAFRNTALWNDLTCATKLDFVCSGEPLIM
jgi:hypothetical protein